MQRILVSLLFSILCLQGFAQGKGTLQLCTDRGLYTSGEYLLFKVFAPQQVQTGFVTLELLDIHGKIISSVYKKVESNQTDGYLYLPDSLKTGTYLLSASAKGNPKATLKELFAINRFSLLTDPSEQMFRSNGTEPVPMQKDAPITIDGMPDTCRLRQQIPVSIHLPQSLLAGMKRDLAISVAAVAPDYRPLAFVRECGIKAEDLDGYDGIQIRGIVRNLATGDLFDKGVVLLSVPDSVPVLDYCFSGEDGSFSFRLKNYYGTFPAILQAYDRNKKKVLKISLDKSDSTRCTLPAFVPAPIPSGIRSIAETQTEIVRLGKIFGNDNLNVSRPVALQKEYLPFYGLPSETVKPALFVDLPDFAEISRELLPGVKYRAYNRIPTLEILNPVTLNYFRDQPLLTLDGVIVHDLNMVRRLGSKDISRIEICRKERFYGDLNFPGVVAIFSVKPDLKRFVESEDLVKLTVEGFQPKAAWSVPGNIRSNEPDLRKVLLWNPSVKPQEVIHLEMKTSDVKGKYLISVQGVDETGRLIIKEQTFEVN
ncbi:MAG: hypothetical protein LWW85_07090 [Marinilabiliales bacterium]|nr:hypothetical protein [Marinilabiliales bacterium]